MARKNLAGSDLHREHPADGTRPGSGTPCLLVTMTHASRRKPWEPDSQLCARRKRSSKSMGPILAKPPPVRQGEPGSGDNAHEALIQFPQVIEDRLANLIDGPHPFRVIGIIDEPARKHFVAIARRIKEVNRLAACYAVSSRPDVERNIIARDNVGSLADLVPRI